MQGNSGASVNVDGVVCAIHGRAAIHTHRLDEVKLAVIFAFSHEGVASRLSILDRGKFCDVVAETVTVASRNRNTCLGDLNYCSTAKMLTALSIAPCHCTGIFHAYRERRTFCRGRGTARFGTRRAAPRAYFCNACSYQARERNRYYINPIFFHEIPPMNNNGLL